ncbi:hypothetical protein SK128_000017, partial [Halocaridina rubra]
MASSVICLLCDTVLHDVSNPWKQIIFHNDTGVRIKYTDATDLYIEPMSHKMSNRRYGFLPLVVFLLSASSTLASVMSTLDELEEIDGALKHTQVSLDDLSSLVFEVFTTDSSSSQTAKEDLVWVNSEVIDNIIDSIVYKARVRIKKENNVRIPREKIISNMHYRIELAEYLDSSQWMADMEEEGKKEVEEEEKDKDLSYEDGKETNTPTSTLGPWRDRVYSVLDDILEVTTAISNGDTHHEQAYRLDQLATLLDTLVEEGLNDTSVLQEINQDDVEYINSIKTKTDDTRKIIKKEIEKAK